MLDRITDSGDDWYVGINGPVRTCGQTGEVIEMNDYQDPMGDYWPMEDDDRRQWEEQMAQKDEEYITPTFEPIDTHEMMFKHLDALKKIYGGK